MISDPVPFMANIALVAHADGKLSANALGQLEAIRQEFKFKRSDYNSAVHMVENGNYRITPVGSFADKVKNLELILRVAYSDDDLDEAEVSLIREFCRAIGIHQEQLDSLCKEVLSSLKQKGRVCPSCGTEIESKSNFCSNCGTNLESPMQDVQVQFQVPATGISIEFAESSAASYPKALEIAKATEGYQTCQKGKKTWHLAVFSSRQLADALPLANCLGGIRNRRLYIEGEEKSWDEVFGFVWCSSQRATAYRPVEYCFGKDDNRLNPWGCKQAQMDWTEWANWFCHGKWEKSGVLGQKLQWRFDKDRIRHELASNLHRFRFCPHLQTGLSQAVLRHFPETVIPDSDPNWDYHQQYEELPGAVKVVQKERSEGLIFKSEFWADGVRPKGLKVFSDILTEAFQELGLTLTSIKALLK